MRLQDLRLSVRRLTCDEDFVRNVVENSEYDPPGFRIGENDVVIDIGGNIGTFALHASRCAANGRVITIEPNRENYDLLLRNLELNAVTNVLPINAAVCGKSGTIKLYNAAQGGFHSVLEDRKENEDCFEIVDAVTLKYLFDTHEICRCNFLKLDCEGAEYEILDTLPIEYFERIDRIAMEWHGDANPGRRRGQSDSLVSRLQSVGFQIDAYEECIGLRCGFIRATNQHCSRDLP